MNERIELIQKVEKWIEMAKEKSLISAGYLAGSIFRSKDFLEKSDIDIVVIADEAQSEQILSYLKILRVETKRVIDLLILSPDYIDTFSPLYKKSNVLLGLAPMLETLEKTPYLNRHFNAFWRCHLVFRRARLNIKDASGPLKLRLDLEKDINYTRLAVVKGSLTLSPDESLADYADKDKNLSENLTWAQEQLEEQFERILSSDNFRLSLPLEKYLHINYWHYKERFLEIRDMHTLARALKNMTEDTIKEVVNLI